MSKPVITKWQEWEKPGNGRGSLSVRIRVMTDPDGTANPSVEVESQLDPFGYRWGRPRRLLCSALSNTPKGYRLVKEAP